MATMCFVWFSYSTMFEPLSLAHFPPKKSNTHPTVSTCNL